MHLSTRLSFDLVAVEQADELSLLVELTAPTSASTDRQPATLQVVLDRSGSMGGGRLEAAQSALIALVDRLNPTDNLGVLAFDTRPEVFVPTGPLTDKAAVKEVITYITSGGGTDLSGGYLRGLQEAQRVAGPTGATVLLISDGHANAGVTDPVRLGAVAAGARAKGVTTTTLGFGLGYDERLLSALAQGGGGNELFAEEADTAVALICGEVDGLLDQVAQAASVRLVPNDLVEDLTVQHDHHWFEVLPSLVELGGIYAGETRRMVFTLQVPGLQDLGLTQVATLELTYVTLPDLVQHSTTVPVMVNVVPGDQAAGRVPDPVVQTEVLFQSAQQAKKRSSELLSRGRVGEATVLLNRSSADLRAAITSLPPELAAELTREARVVDALAEEAVVDASRAAKASSTSSTLGTRHRGRRTRGGRVVLSCLDGCADLALEEWELSRLQRDLPDRLAMLLLPGSTARDREAALALAAELGPDHPSHGFFARCAEHQGFTVERA